MNSDLIKNVLGSEDAGHDLLDAIDASVSAWLADAELDADELSEIRRLEAQARALIETDLIQHEHLGAGVDKILPGAPYLMLG